MSNLSIEELKKLREAYLWNGVSDVTAILDELIAIRELKGEQVPVAVVEPNDNLTVAEILGDIPRRKAVRELYEGALVLGQELFAAPQKPVVPVGFLFVVKATGAVIYSIADTAIEGTQLISQIYGDAAIEAAGGLSTPQATIEAAPQKPVISKEKLCDWLEDNFDIDDSQRAAFAAYFSHCCDCIVQSDLPAPVGEIVAWSGTDRDKGITREIDFRFLRFDVLPGTKLYAVKPAPATKSDLLTRAQALAVETRALACRIKAGD